MARARKKNLRIIVEALILLTALTIVSIYGYIKGFWIIILGLFVSLPFTCIFAYGFYCHYTNKGLLINDYHLIIPLNGAYPSEKRIEISEIEELLITNKSIIFTTNDSEKYRLEIKMFDSPDKTKEMIYTIFSKIKEFSPSVRH